MLPHPSGLSAPCVVIESDGEERWIERTPVDYAAESPDALRDLLRDCRHRRPRRRHLPQPHQAATGRCGTHRDAGHQRRRMRAVDHLRRSADARAGGRHRARHRHPAPHRLGRTRAGRHRGQQAAGHRRHARRRRASAGIEVVPVPTRYPAGGEKQLIRVLTGIEIPYGRLGTEFGVQCFNVGTAYACTAPSNWANRCLAHRHPHRQRRAARQLGSADRHADRRAARAGGAEGRHRPLHHGRPDDGLHPAAHRPAGDQGRQLHPRRQPRAVPAAGAGDALHPLRRLHARLPGRAAAARAVLVLPREKLRQGAGIHIFDCIECGCCAYVCPSNIRLVDYYRFAKTSMRALEREKAAADAARERFEFRNSPQRARSEGKGRAPRRQDRRRAAGHGRRRTTGRHDAVSAGSADDHGGSAGRCRSWTRPRSALIAAAIERARAQKEGVQPKNIDNLAPEKQAEIREIEARRAKCARLAKTPPEEPV
jgi:electron transport complex protein RnfC